MSAAAGRVLLRGLPEPIVAMLLVIMGVAGLVVGLAVGVLFGEVRSARRQGGTQAELAAAQQQSQGLTLQLESQNVESRRLRDELSGALVQQAAVQAQLEAAQANVLEQRELLEDAQIKLREAFGSLSADALARNNEKFLQLAKENFAVFSKEASGVFEQRNAQIDAQIKPLREVLGQYQQRLGDIEKSRVESYSMLREQLGTLTETQRALNQQTGQLVTALSRPGTRGQWGEMSLRRLVELAGMTRRCDFVEQASVEGEDGKLRPDMVVHLPNQRDVVIDCKAPLDAFLDAAAAQDEESRKNCLQRHAQQVRHRFRELSTKNYASYFDRTPEFVVMFLPGEAFLYAAVEADGALLEDAMKNQVIIATPTTLLSLLKAIAYGWRQEEVTQQAENIHKLGKQLFERVRTLAEHLERLGKAIGSAVGAYNQTIGSIQTRVLPAAKKLGELTTGEEDAIAETRQVDAMPRELTADAT